MKHNRIPFAKKERKSHFLFSSKIWTFRNFGDSF